MHAGQDSRAGLASSNYLVQPVFCRSLLLATLLGGLGFPTAHAAVMGGARATPYPEAVERTRVAAEAVLGRKGTETCLRGKLTNALLGLSASCDAAGQRNSLCSLADEAVVQIGWSLDFMDTTATQLLTLMADAPLASGTETSGR